MIKFDISDEIRALGVTGAYFLIEGFENRPSDSAFRLLRDDELHRILSNPVPLSQDVVLRGYRTLHEAVGVSNRKHVASPENLLSYLHRTGTLPEINLIVDIYNLVSVQTRLALGAHDVAKISGSVHLRMTTGTEGYLPLGTSDPTPVRPEIYAYIDDANDVICYLEVKQVEKTKIEIDTRDAFYIVQGNGATTVSQIREAVDLLIQLTKEHCGGHEKMLWAPWLS